jgi:hypothetical protein
LKTINLRTGRIKSKKRPIYNGARRNEVKVGCLESNYRFRDFLLENSAGKADKSAKL